MSLAEQDHQDCKFDEQYIYRQSLAPIQPCLPYAPEASPTDHTVDLHNRAGMMMQSMAVSEASAEDIPELTAAKESAYMQTQPWELQQVEQEDAKPTTAAPTTPSPSIHTYPSGQNWSGSYDTPFDWPHALQQAATFIIPNSESQFHQNHTLVYNTAFATQSTVDKGYGAERRAWASTGLNGLPRGPVDRSVSPGSMLDQSSPTENWNGYSITANNAALSTPCRPFLAQKIDSSVGLSGLPRASAGMGMTTVPSTGSSRQDLALMAPLDDDQKIG